MLCLYSLSYQQEPYFSPTDFGSLESDAEFLPAVTDSGLCYVSNGNALANTYAPSSKRNQELGSVFDLRPHVESKRIKGTGKAFKKTLWLDVSDK